MILFICCLSNYVHAQDKISLSSENLRGKIKHVKYYYYNDFSGRNDSSITTDTYDSIGNLIDRESGNSKCTWEYNGSGNLIKITEHMSYPGYASGSYVTYKYDILNRMTEEYRTMMGGYMYVYDKKGNLIEKNSFDRWGDRFISLGSCYIYDYNNMGNKIKETEFYNGNIYKITTYKTDSIGHVIEENVYNPKSIDYRTSSWKYDAHGNKIEEQIYWEPSHKLEMHTLFKYDKWSNVTEEIDFSANRVVLQKISKKISNLYEDFDKYGNWLKKTTLVDDSPSEITKREIEYY